MKPRNMQAMRLCLLAAVLIVAAGASNADAGILPTGFVASMCAGSGTYPGIIAAKPVIGISAGGATSSVMVLTAAIISVIILVMGAAYMIARAGNFNSLMGFLRSEMVEMGGTLVILVIFFGGFLTIGSLITSSQLAFSGPGRSVFVDSCGVVATASVNLAGPILGIGALNWVINTAASLSISVGPDGFGFQDDPIKWISIYSSTLSTLSTVATDGSIFLLAVTFMLGIIYSLFPIFLYMGVVMRAVPWTRAAGGILIAIFIGFYIMFPILLVTILGSFSSFAAYNTQLFSAQVSGTTALASGSGLAGVISIGGNTNQAGAIQYLMTSIQNSYCTAGQTGTGASGGTTGSSAGAAQCPGQGYGIINGFIYEFIEPIMITIAGVLFVFLISFDFTDLLADLLGAPSLSSGGLWRKFL